jgi:hypothetical protein
MISSTPFKASISKWISPDLMKGQPISASKAKKAIADYKKAVGRADGMAEPSIFYCEEAFGFLESCSIEDESYFAVSDPRLQRSIEFVSRLPPAERTAYLERLDKLRSRGRNVGYVPHGHFRHPRRRFPREASDMGPMTRLTIEIKASRPRGPSVQPTE